MHRFHLGWYFIIGLSLVACSVATETTSPVDPQVPAVVSPVGVEPQPTTDGSERESPYPPPIHLPVVQQGLPYPDPAPEEAGSGQNPPGQEETEDLAGGGLMERGEAFVDEVDVKITAGDLTQVTFLARGHLPTPCHQLVFIPGQPDADGRLNLYLYSQSDPSAICAQVLEPFEFSFDLGYFPPGKYTLVLNDQIVKELDLSGE
jgi:hypothetical protein